MAECETGISRSVIIAADVAGDKLSPLVKATHDVPGIGGYKVGLALGLDISLPETVRRVREFTNLPIIYDHQKAGNDIPAMGSEFARVCYKAGVDAIILFPFSSPVTERDWIKAAQDRGLSVWVGGHMTVPNFLESEDGFIADSAPERIYQIAAESWVTDFVVPGNKVEYVGKYRQLLSDLMGDGSFTLNAPGFITQKGEISEFAHVAGKKWRAIVGSAIYKATDMRAAAELMTAQIR